MTPALIRRFMSPALLGGLSAMLSASAIAADPYPSKPIRVVVPYAAGGTTDQLARILQPALSESLGQQLLIDNKPGAGGTIGTEMAVTAPPDGYTLVFGNNGPNALIQLMRSVPYDPIKDLRPVALVALTPMFFTVPADSPAKTLKDFIAYAKQNDGKLNIGSVGQGSFSHVTASRLEHAAHPVQRRRAADDRLRRRPGAGGLRHRTRRRRPSARGQGSLSCNRDAGALGRGPGRAHRGRGFARFQELQLVRDLRAQGHA
jgi:tripartite-type tricarboxylate transporter receptor subunit TctC